MAFNSILDIPRQGRIDAGEVADLKGSITLGQTLTVLGDEYLKNVYTGSINDNILSISSTGLVQQINLESKLFNYFQAGTGISLSLLNSKLVITNTGVTSFNGRTGSILPALNDYNTDLVNEGNSNLYYNDSRVSQFINTIKGVAGGIVPLNSETKIDPIYLYDSGGGGGPSTDDLEAVMTRGNITNIDLIFNKISSDSLIKNNTNSSNLVLQASDNLTGSSGITLFGQSSSSFSKSLELRFGSTGSTIANMQAQTNGVALVIKGQSSDFTNGGSRRFLTLGIDGKLILSDDDSTTVTYAGYRLEVKDTINLINAKFWGRVIGSPAVNANEFTTLSQINSLLSNYNTKTEISNFFSGSTVISGYNKSNWDSVFTWYNSNPLLGYVPVTRNITINGNTQNLIQDRTWDISFSSLSGKPTTVSGYGITDVVSQILNGYTLGTAVSINSSDSILQAFGKIQSQFNAFTSGAGNGTVTSVAMTVPTGLSIAGSPITTNGTLAVSLSSGYSIPLISKQTNWDTAFSWGNHAGLYLPIHGTADNSTLWNGQVFNPSLGGVPASLMGFNTGSGAWTVISQANVSSFLGLGSAAYINADLAGFQVPTTGLLSVGTDNVIRQSRPVDIQTWLSINNGSTLNNNISGTATYSTNWNTTLVNDFNIPTGYRLLQANGATIPNQPNGAEWGAGIQFSTNGDVNYQNQIVFSISGSAYLRSKVSGTWNPWDRFLGDSETSTINTNSATIVRRNTTGQVYASYFNTEATVETFTPNKMYASYDNYIRAVDKASVAQFLGLGSFAYRNSINGNEVYTDRLNGEVDISVATQLRWKNYGNGHTIFDASNGTSPQGNAISNRNSQVAWDVTYPTLMGWNGNSSYGVRVDSARVADNSNAWLGQTYGTTESTVNQYLMGYGPDGQYHPITRVNVNAFLGINDNSTLSNNINGNSATSTFSRYVQSLDGNRNPDTFLPQDNPNRVRFDFTNAGSTATGGNYSGTMTFSPWIGNTASTGDASYQLAFGSTAAGGGGFPMLKIRKGIDATWNSWYDVYTTANLTVSQTPVAYSAVQRDANGYIQNNWFNSSRGDDTTTVAYSYIFDGGDGYMRKKPVYYASLDLVDLQNRHFQMRNTGGGTGYNQGTLELMSANSPVLGFHWEGVVASTIGIEASGRIAIRNNPGTAYESLICSTFQATSSIYTDGTMTANGAFVSNTSIESKGQSHAAAGSNGGFTNVGYNAGHNNIWRLNNAIEYGIGYYQGGADNIGFHFGDRNTPKHVFNTNSIYYNNGGIQLNADGTGNDPYGFISVTRGPSQNYSYYGMTRSGQIGIGIGVSTSNQFVIGGGSGSGAAFTSIWFSLDSSGSGSFGGSVTAAGGGYNSHRHLKHVYEGFNEEEFNALDQINKLHIRKFSYLKNIENVSMGLIIDEIPEELNDLMLMNGDSVDIYTLHGLSLMAHKQTKKELENTRLELEEVKDRLYKIEEYINNARL